jgi:hypothetical protein
MVDQNARARSRAPLLLRTIPGDYVYQHTADWRDLIGQRQSYDAVVHAVTLLNNYSQEIFVQSLAVEAQAGGKAFQRVVFGAEDIEQLADAAAAKDKLGMRRLIDFILCTDSAMEPAVKLSSSAGLQPGMALVLPNIYLLFHKKSDSIKITATFSLDGITRDVQSTLRVSNYICRNTYAMPLEGTWLMKAMPVAGIMDHHRFAAASEFGVDFLKMGQNGELYASDGSRAGDYFAYGERVLAAAGGKVVAARGDLVQVWSRFNPKEGETAAQFQERQFRQILEALKADLGGWAAGNHIVIEHTGGEYSAYLHLKENSLRIKTSEIVIQGQHIADVGNTGDSFGAHLHFQVMDCPDLVRGRSLPFVFNKVEAALSEPGIVIQPC